jgi:iron complex outermembrane receptor protein
MGGFGAGVRRPLYQQDAGDDLRFQFYIDLNKRADQVFATTADAVDFDLQHRFAAVTRHDLVWGVGYRRDHDETQGSFKVAFDPPERSTHLLSAFVHDEIALAPDRLRLALGAKFEHNGYSGFEYQPSARLLWLPAAHQILWAAVSRPVRSPARADQDIRLAFRAFSLNAR